MLEVKTDVTGSVWKIEVQPGDVVEAGDIVVIVESMKMEMPVEASTAGTIREILCDEGESVTEGQSLLLMEPA